MTAHLYRPWPALGAGTTFNSLEEKNLTKLALTDNAPKGRYVSPGLNAEGVCLNVEGCEAARVKRSVIIPRGFGVVRPIEEVGECVTSKRRAAPCAIAVQSNPQFV